ncbi:Heat-labile enterotoxin, A chain [Akanthomyces lecanii RCEF 1005]|uniref:Heat-labile enterotoxin, A chain n=1 Tax=Akanthomyces lecanii RCEF 1005 TaxID=1081108 RepID=A0A168C6B0_CORDF|nr:Heat-labile enterotoxin, A chain [Akanthomyces lecanii RCEF 1005]
MRIFTARQSRITWLSLTVLAAFFLFIGLSHGHPSPGGNLHQLSRRGNSDSKPKGPKPPKGPKGGEPSGPPPATAPSKGKKVGFKKNIDRLPKFELPKEPLVTYRGETRDPGAIEAAEGFFPREPTRALTEAETEAGSSIFSHVAVKVAKEYTKYVSTSMDPGAASDFGKSTGYVYVVAPDQKMVNVPETLGEFLPSEFAKESELAAVGKIPFEQVRGWIKKNTALRPGDWLKLRDLGPKLSGEPLTEELRQQLGKTLADAYTPNTKYDAAKYDKTRASGGRPELAGFPKDSPAWQDERWKPFQNKKVSESLKEFLSETVCAKEEACVAGQLTSKAGEAGVPDPYKDVDPPCKETDLKKRDGEGACVLPDDAPDEEEGTEPSNDTEPEGTENTEPAEEGLGGETPETGLSESEKVDLAQKTSNEVFEDLFTSRKLSEKASEWGLKVQDARTQLVGYKPLTEQSPHFSMSKAGLALEGAALVAWGVGMAQAFTSNSTGWEKAAAVTALIPFVGCGFNAIAESETKEGIDVIDQMLCITADILLFTPLAPFAFAIQVFRVIAGMFKTPSMPKAEEVQETRDKAWSTILDDKVYTYYYSDDSLSRNRKFRDKLNGTMYADTMAIVSDAADLIAAANATMQASAKGPNVDKEQINAVVLNVTDQIKAGISPKIVARQREFLLQLPQRIKEGTDLSVQKMAEQFNKETMTQLTSNAMVKKYTPFVPVVEGDPGVDLEPQVRGELGALAAHLEKTPLPLPKLFDVAYVLGQSKGMLDIDPQTLNPSAFIKSRAPEMSQDDVDFYALHHALQISMLLRGTTTEDKLSKLWPSDGDDKTVQELQLLLALKFGRTFDSQKMAAAAQLAGQFATPQEIQFMTHPSVPPLKIESESMAYMGLILDLSEERITGLPRFKEVVGFKDLGTDEKLIMAMLEKAKELFVERQENNNSTLPEEGQAAAAA